MSLEKCPDCGNPFGSFTQEVLPGTGTPKLCFKCAKRRRIKWMLAALPRPDSDQWGDLTDWEQNFLTKIRAKFKEEENLTIGQYDKLEQVYRIRDGS